jgi:integrase
VAKRALGRATGYLESRDIRWRQEEAGYLRRYVLSRPWLARLPVADLKASHTRQLLAELKGTVSEATGKVLSPKTVANIYGAYRTMIHQARVDELVGTDPCVLPKGTLQRKSKRTRVPYEPEHVATLTADPRLPADRRVWNALAFYTGMREGEVCGRRWRDWDRTSRPLGCLTVATQYSDRPLKTERHQDDKPRRVPVHPALAEILDWWWAEGFEFFFARRPTLDDFIVPNRDGGPHTRSSAYKAWRRSCAIVGVLNRSLHSTRHTFISIARRNGARKDVLERITHNAQGDIVDQYTHWDWAPLCEVILTFRCDARCDASDSEAENKWRRWESNRGPDWVSGGSVRNSPGL